MQSSRTRVTISTSRLSMERSPTADPSGSDKSQKRISNIVKVMFQEPGLSSIDKKRESSVPLLEISSATDQRFRDRPKDESTIFFKGDAVEGSFKEAVKVDSYDVLKEIEARSKKQLASQAELSRPPSGPFKRPDQFSNKERGSAERSPEFRGYTIEGMLAQYPASRQKIYLEDVESALRTTNQHSTMNSGTRMRCSENIGVQSMLFDPPQTDSLPGLEANAFAIVLQEALDFLDLLEHTIPAPVDERWNDDYKTIDERYGKSEEPEVMFREDMGLLPSIPTVSQKIQRDRTYIYNILKSTIKDVRCSRRYDKLETEVDDIVRTMEGEHGLEVNYEIWMGQVKQLRELIESDRLKNDREAKNLIDSTQRMNNEIDDVKFFNSSKLVCKRKPEARRRSGYVERWEESRLEQQKLRLEIKERESNDALGDCEKMERADQIVSEEVRIFLQANTKDLEEETEVWTSRCNEQVERCEQDINDMKEKIELQKLELQNLNELRDQRQDFLNECYDEKERIRNETEYWTAVNDAAIAIETLWRGYMVRHQLGQYKNLWITLKKRKRRAAITRKKNEEWGKKKKAEWGSSDLKKLKNIVDPNA